MSGTIKCYRKVKKEWMVVKFLGSTWHLLLMLITGWHLILHLCHSMQGSKNSSLPQLISLGQWPNHRITSKNWIPEMKRNSDINGTCSTNTLSVHQVETDYNHSSFLWEAAARKLMLWIHIMVECISAFQIFVCNLSVNLSLEAK